MSHRNVAFSGDETASLLRKHGGKTSAELKAAANQTKPLHHLNAEGLRFGGNS